MISDDELLLFSLLAFALSVARKKHPVFAEGADKAWEVINTELKELEYAIANESEERQRDEAIDVAVTALRFALGEHK